MASGKQTVDAPTTKLFLMDPDQLTIIGLDTPHKAGDHPLYDERIALPVNPESVQNVVFYGIKQAIIATQDGDKSVVVDGRQRVRWARAANDALRKRGAELLRVPVRFQRGEAGDLLGVLVSCNENRQNDDLMVKIEKAARMLNMGKVEKEIAVAFCVQPQTVRNWMLIYGTIPEVKEAIRLGKLTPSVGIRLGRESQEKQTLLLGDLLKAQKEGINPTVVAVDAAKRGLKEEYRVANAKDAKPPTGEAVEPPEAFIVPPGKRLLRAILKAYDADEAPATSIDPQVINAIKWMLGDLGNTAFPGLKKTLNSFNKKP